MAHDEVTRGDASATGATGCPEYQQLSRRGFVGVAGATAAILASHAWLPRVSFAREYRSSQRDIVVSVFLRGASDGLSVCVPYFENAYYTNRPTLAVARPDTTDPNRVTALDDRFGLAPSMLPLLPAFQAGKLLFVHACGSLNTSRSHFEAQRYMEQSNASPSAPNTGWLGRHIASVAPMDALAPLRAVAISGGLPLTLTGGIKTLPISNLDTFGITGSSTTQAARRAVLNDVYTGTTDPLRASALATLQTIDMLNLIDFVNYVPANGAVYTGAAGSFGYAMKTSAALIKAQLGVEAISIDVGGWDTHENQGTVGGSLGTLMGTLATNLAAFYSDVIASPSAPRVTVVVMSEFGRRLLENGSRGTDHGYANCMMVLGQCVFGGRVMTNWPGLGPGQLFQNRDLNVTIDYRDILAEVVQSRLGNPNLSAVFPSFTPTPRGVFSC